MKSQCILFTPAADTHKHTETTTGTGNPVLITVTPVNGSINEATINKDNNLQEQLTIKTKLHMA